MTGRSHGSAPFHNVVVHGGPGAPGSAYGIAAGISGFGVLEPFQTARTVDGQIEELADTIQRDAEPPVALVGHSWGAMLGALVAAERPDLLRKLVLVCSGGFTAESYVRTSEVRMARLAPKDRNRAEEIQAIRRANPNFPEAALMREYYDLVSRADAYDPDPTYIEPEAEFQNDVNKQVWAGAIELRESGELARRILAIRCPVVALHGEHDPHPADAVAGPLSALPGFKMLLLPKCGHEPWKERQARDRFFELLQEELA